METQFLEMIQKWRPFGERGVRVHVGIFRNFAVFFPRLLLRSARAVTSAKAKNTKQHTQTRNKHTNPNQTAELRPEERGNKAEERQRERVSRRWSSG